jgi:hypothetical protein
VLPVFPKSFFVYEKELGTQEVGLNDSCCSLYKRRKCFEFDYLLLVESPKREIE